MAYQLAADLVLVVHLLFLLFVTLGGLLIFVRSAWMLVHLPAAFWGTYVELSGSICPLTWLENHLLQQAGGSGYSESFIGHYLLAVIYPDGLTRELQLWLGIAVAILNGMVYGAWLLGRWRDARKPGLTKHQH